MLPATSARTSWISATDLVATHVGAALAPAALAHDGLDDPAGNAAALNAMSFFCNRIPKRMLTEFQQQRLEARLAFCSSSLLAAASSSS